MIEVAHLRNITSKTNKRFWPHQNLNQNFVLYTFSLSSSTVCWVRNISWKLSSSIIAGCHWRTKMASCEDDIICSSPEICCWIFYGNRDYILDQKKTYCQINGHLFWFDIWKETKLITDPVWKKKIEQIVSKLDKYVYRGFHECKKGFFSTIFHLKNLVISNLIMSFTWKILVGSKVFSLIEAIFSRFTCRSTWISSWHNILLWGIN